MMSISSDPITVSDLKSPTPFIESTLTPREKIRPITIQMDSRDMAAVASAPGNSATIEFIPR